MKIYKYKYNNNIVILNFKPPILQYTINNNTYLEKHNIILKLTE
jgi:hypothetical protein